ncbi:hypothetical protein Anas_06684 [Armadillidium nasatum]|uniref:Uncharacterized protein n=1 Tax=Armadillidium nasatum TaxID=96803 RepID=A0A5N5SSA9_9CRUS|nr:hypothetical protein Anas_06684 [Armadillidium nasatum]
MEFNISLKCVPTQIAVLHSSHIVPNYLKGISSLTKQACECSLFLKDENWLPRYEVISLTDDFQVNCSQPSKATENCKEYCADEMVALNSLYKRDPSVLRDYPPSQLVPCEHLPLETVSFSQKSGTKFMTPGTKSWLYTLLNFFGYKSFGELVKKIDIFSLPGKVQSAVRTYKDEMSLGRCYMEFTTFKVFTKQENPFENFLRRKRDAEYMGPITRFDEYVDSGEASSGNGNSNSGGGTEHASKMKALNGETIKNLVSGVVGMLERSESTKQYAHLLNSFLPLVSQFIPGGEDSSSSPASLLLKFAGPLLSQMGNSRPVASNSIGNEYYPSSPTTKIPKNPSWPNLGPTSQSASSPLASMALNVIGNLISNYFGYSGAQNRIETVAQTTTRPTQPSTTPAPAQDFATSGLRTLLKLFLQSASGSASAAARPIETPKPAPKPSQNLEKLSPEEKEEKRFISMLLDLIRPIFISIIGNAPGDSGVKDIRKVSTLSTLGRVDDTLREEVESPFFCFKKYLVNKAWSLTENGVRGVVTTFTPEEQARMMSRITP